MGFFLYHDNLKLFRLPGRVSRTPGGTWRMIVIINPVQLVQPVCVSAVKDRVVGAVTLRQIISLSWLYNEIL